MAFHQYNTFQYNTSLYNADAFFFIVSLSESVGSVDDRLGGAFKVLADTIASSDIATKYFQAGSKFEFVFLSDSVSKSILNKGFSESLRLNDWLQISRSGSNWNS